MPLLSCCFFFFQAEDGIRDIGVTGVQTCALPISRHGTGAELPLTNSSSQAGARIPRSRRSATAAAFHPGPRCPLQDLQSLGVAVPEHADPTLADVVAALDARYDPALTEPWDAVGLVCGDPAEPVRSVLLAVDPTSAVVDEALERGVDLVVTHHPLLLTPVHG